MADPLGFVLDIGGGIVGLGSNILDFGWKGATGAVDVVWGAGDFLVNDLPGVVKGLEPIVEVIGQGYKMYQSYEQQKAAQEAAQRYGGQVVVPYPVPTGPGQIVPAQTAAGPPRPMAKPPRAMDTEKLMLYAGGAALAYILFFK